MPPPVSLAVLDSMWLSWIVNDDPSTNRPPPRLLAPLRMVKPSSTVELPMLMAVTVLPLAEPSMIVQPAPAPLTLTALTIRMFSG